jgi:hypothetical protein
MSAVLRGERTADVPCDGCVGCCVSAYAIALRPSDLAALAAVPACHLKLPVDGGLALMGHREDGTCPMLEAGRCVIYADRPQTCRDYDCRIYAATGLMPDGQRPVIQDRVREWRFDVASAGERAQLAALQRAARFICDHAALFSPAGRTLSTAAIAVLAVKVWPLFANEEGDGSEETSPAEMARRVTEAARAFDAR